MENIQDCAHCFWLHNAHDCMDVYSFGLPGELCYEGSGVGWNAYRCLFCYKSVGSRDIAYCVNVNLSSNCFACSGLIRKEYCIFNKQYSKTEYEVLVPRIIRHMQRRNEWGEFFPMRVSLLPYNTSVAQDYFPLEKREAVALGLLWRDETDIAAADLGPLPASLEGLTDSLAKEAFASAVSGKPYRIIPQELRFLRERRLAPPTATVFERHLRRLNERTPRRVWERTCALCKEHLLSSYAPYRKETIFC